MKKIIRNGLVLNKNFEFIKANVLVDNSFIEAITIEKIQDMDREEINAKGKYVIPGLFDIHTHGNSGYDFCDADRNGLETMAEYLGKNGITSFLATTMSLPGPELEVICDTIQSYHNKPLKKGARLEGIYLEGPFLNPMKKGAQNQDHIIRPDIGLFDKLFAASKGLIKVATVAPELDENNAFICHAKQLCVVSIAHTNASYEETKAGIKAGIRNATHLYNAMPGYNHREPGAVGAILDSPVFTELIADGIHIHPAVMRITYHTVGEDRLIFISDSMRATGVKDGSYNFAGQTVTVSRNKATLDDGTIAGSVTNLMDCVRVAVASEIPLEKAIKCASLNPARLLHMEKKIGSIEVGKYANIVLLDKHLQVDKVFIKGENI